MFSNTFLIGLAISILIAILAFVLSERLLPTVENEEDIKKRTDLDAEEKSAWLNRLRKRKNFWSITIALTALLVGVCMSLIILVLDNIKNLDGHISKIENEIDLINGNYRKIEDKDTKETFQSLYSEYLDRYLSTTNDEKSKKWSQEIAEWTRKDIRNLTNEIEDGKVELLSHRIIDALLPLYDKCEIGVIASNVGSTKSFFNEAYIRANKSLFIRGKPLVRFFIYSRKVPLELVYFSGIEPVSYEDYKEEVLKLHDETTTTISVIINYDEIRKEAVQRKIHRDMMIVDGQIKAEAEITRQSWEILHETLTNNPRYLEEGQSAFKSMSQLLKDKNTTIISMPDSLIRKSYENFISVNGINPRSKGLGIEILLKLVSNR